MRKLGGKFKELQKYWYSLLEQSGFKDIEKLVDGNLVLKTTSTIKHQRIDAFDCHMDAEYFRCLFHKINDKETTYRNEVDRVVMQMHAEGYKIKDIIDALKNMDVLRSRASVRFIIRKYEMLWEIKYYTPKQLNKKCS